MKVLLISEYFPVGKDLTFSGGVEARTFFVAKNLAKKHHVHVITSRLPKTRQYEKIHGINVHRVGSTRCYQANARALSIFSLISFVNEGIKIGDNIKPDIVDGGNFICHFMARRIAIKNKVPLVFWYPDVFIGQWIKTYGLISGMSGWLLEKYNLTKKADIFISISKKTTDKLIKNGIWKKLIREIPCGVEPQEFKRNNKKDFPKSIVCISRLVAYKNVEDLVWAFALLRKRNISCILKIIGTGQEEEKLKKITSMLKLKKYVKFYKNFSRRKLIDQIKSSAILCSPSSIEGFGISIIEAAAGGVPYVISNTAIFREITKNGKGGLFFEEKDLKNLSLKLETLLTDRHIYLKKKDECLKLAKNYNWQKTANQTESVYLSLI